MTMPPRTPKERLNYWIHSPAIELTLAALILGSVAVTIAEIVLKNRGGAGYTWASLLGYGLMGLFSLELGLRYWVARNKTRFWRRYWLDLIAVLPYPPQFPILHLFRLIRLFRASVFLNRNLDFISPVLSARISAQLGIFVVIVWVLLAGGLGIYLLEREQNPNFRSLRTALWWSVFTLLAGEPIGGEAITEGGRLITLGVVLCGLSTFAVLTGLISALMVQRLKTALEVKSLDLDELQNHILICGWNRSGPPLIEELQADPELRYCSIVIVAELEQMPELKTVKQSQLYFHRGDYTMMEVLERVGIYQASRAILLADDTYPRSDQDRDARTVLASLTIEKLHPSIYTCAQLLDRKNNVQLRASGIEDIVVADELTSQIIATTVRNKGALDVVAELLSVQVGNQIYKIPAPETWIGLPFWSAVELVKDQGDALLVAVEHQTFDAKETVVNPSKQSLLLRNDHLIMIAQHLPRLSTDLGRFTPLD